MGSEMCIRDRAAPHRIVLPFLGSPCGKGHQLMACSAVEPGGVWADDDRPAITGGEPLLAVSSRSRSTRHPCASVRGTALCDCADLLTQAPSIADRKCYQKVTATAFLRDGYVTTMVL